MRYVYSSAALAVLLTLISPSARGQGGTSNLSIAATGYMEVSEQRVDRMHWYVTSTATLSNTGQAFAGVTAAVTSLVPNIQIVAGQGTLHFSPVPAGTPGAPSLVVSSDSFTILVDRSVPFDWSQVQWTFQN